MLVSPLALRSAAGFVARRFFLVTWLQSCRDPFDRALEEGINAGEIDGVDIAGRDWHHVAMRRQLRPLWFPAPVPEQQKHAEKLLIQAAQKGCLDFPAIVHGPIENFLISHLCRTSITPNQLTLITNIVAWAATFCFASGHLGWGAILALAVGILDGLDGKQARVKIQTSRSENSNMHSMPSSNIRGGLRLPIICKPPAVSAVLWFIFCC
jgi:hypothetical protein